MRFAVYFLMHVFLFSQALFAQRAESELPSIGPENGTLVIVGGGRVGTEIYEAFARYAGGFDAAIVVIPTANVPEQIDTARLGQRWRNAGFTNIIIAHSTDPKIADTDSFALLIENARGVWFEGGRQWRLVDAYYETASYDAFHKVLRKGGVIGGSSAGATIQGSFLARGDESGNAIMISPNEKHRIGFAFLKNAAIDQHVDARNRWTDIQEIIRQYPALLGIGIAESTALIVQGDVFRVIGPGKVAVTEYKDLEKETNDNPYLLLKQGDRYDLRNRLVIK